MDRGTKLLLGLGVCLCVFGALVGAEVTTGSTLELETMGQKSASKNGFIKCYSCIDCKPGDTNKWPISPEECWVCIIEEVGGSKVTARRCETEEPYNGACRNKAVGTLDLLTCFCETDLCNKDFQTAGEKNKHIPERQESANNNAPYIATRLYATIPICIGIIGLLAFF